jgi:hypothetical protein
MRTPCEHRPKWMGIAPRAEGVSPLAEIDRKLAGDLTLDDLVSMKDQLLQMVGAGDGAAKFATGARLARVNLRLRGHQEAQLQNSDWQRYFIGAAKRLLDESTFALLTREAEMRAAEAASPKTSLPNPQPALSAPLSAPVVRAKFLPPRAAQQAPPLVARVHELVSAAAQRPMKFDPTALFREFGREQVIGLWNMLAPERRPETAAEFRELLRRGKEAAGGG